MFIPDPETDYNYTVKWYHVSEIISRAKIKHHESSKYDAEFQSKTALTEFELKEKGIRKLPYSVCKNTVIRTSVCHTF